MSDREPTQSVELSGTSYREPNQILEESSNNKNGWSAKEDPNRKLFLHTLKDEIEKIRNQAEKKKVVFISYAWEKSGSDELKKLAEFHRTNLLGFKANWINCLLG